jgi:hypothetical protein
MALEEGLREAKAKAVQLFSAGLLRKPGLTTFSQ